MTLALAGPMTGKQDFNRQAFNEAQAKLEAAGYRVLNPARHADGKKRGIYLMLGLADVYRADGVALLPGYLNSSGAKIQVALADAMGKDASLEGVWRLRSLARRNS